MFPSSGADYDQSKGWGELAYAQVVAQADEWLARQAANPYRKVWYTPDHGYFTLGAWGINGWRHIRWLAGAYAITGDVKYRNGAALGVNWMHGSNPQGRPYSTGIGHTPLTTLLDLESWRNGGNKYDEPVPGE